MIKAFKRLTTTIPEIQQVINNIAEFVKPLENNPILDGRVLSGVSIGTSATNIPHKLGRPWVGWFVISRTSGVVPYEGTQLNTTDYLTLQAASAITVDLYVF